MTQIADYQVILMTGQSDPPRCALSPLQQAFLDHAVPRRSQVSTNFPYDLASAPYRATPLFVASLRNGWQYIGSRSRSFAHKHASKIIAIVERRERTYFLTGSCGLELFNNLNLPTSLQKRICLFALGPVARRRPECDHLLVGSRRDRLSRCFFPTPDRWVDCTHLDYLRSTAVKTLWTEFIGRAGVRPLACGSACA